MILLHLVRFLFGILWISLGVAILTKQTWLMPDFFAGRPPEMIQLAGLAACVFGVYNLVRLYAPLRRLLSKHPADTIDLREALAARRREPTATTQRTVTHPNPDLDFSDQNRPS